MKIIKKITLASLLLVTAAGISLSSYAGYCCYAPVTENNMNFYYGSKCVSSKKECTKQGGHGAGNCGSDC